MLRGTVWLSETRLLVVVVVVVVAWCDCFEVTLRSRLRVLDVAKEME